MRLLDLFCGAGGAGVGYARAGFDVVGVDIKAQPRYPFRFHKGDALAFLERHGAEFDAIHASPPCQDHSALRHATGQTHGTGHLLDDTRQALMELGRPWVIENVPGAPMRVDFQLCGCMFGLPGLRRERWFETSWQGFDLRPPCLHVGRIVTVAGHGTQGKDYAAGKEPVTQAQRQEAMGIHWMNRNELAQAIPPAYTEYLGEQLLAHAWEPAPKPREVVTLPGF